MDLPSELLAFCGVAALFSLAPGPDTLLVVNRALSYGRRSALLTALGSASGLLAWGILSAFGVAAVFGASATAFTALKLVGAAYLIILGVQTIYRAHVSAIEQTRTSEREETPQPPPRWTFRQGLLTNLLNPKAGIFFVAILPQFVAPNESVLATTLIFALIDACFSLLALSLYTLLGLVAAGLLRRPKARRVVDRVTGTILVALGLRLAVEPD